MGEVNSSLRYRNYVYDNETGFYYLNSRYYDPVTCRFVNEGVYYSTGQGITGSNMYEYCNNSPVSCYDPTGTWTFECCPYGNCPYCKGDNITVIRDVTNEVNAALFPEAEKSASKWTDASNIKEEIEILSYFRSRVTHGAPWDIKVEESWKQTIGTDFPGKKTIVIYDGIKMTPENLGNYTYGYLGSAYGFSLQLLCLASYYAAGLPVYGSDLENEIGSDWSCIVLGYNNCPIKPGVYVLWEW